jgi:hypothetical protein
VYSSSLVILPSPVAFSHEPKSKKRNVYAETVASFGKLHVSKHVSSTLNHSRTTASATPPSILFCDHHPFASYLPTSASNSGLLVTPQSTLTNLDYV